MTNKFKKNAPVAVIWVSLNLIGLYLVLTGTTEGRNSSSAQAAEYLFAINLVFGIIGWCAVYNVLEKGKE